jgi:molybdenum cofactor synthesis domain-containing protein
MGRIDAVCISNEKGERKIPVESAIVLANHGIDSDAHAGPWHRQVSLLGAEDIQTMRDNLPDVGPGDFAENIILSGLDLASLGLGTRLRLGCETVLSITQIGKVCHTPCRIFHLTGDCIMPKLGLFARVLEGGKICVGDDAEVFEAVRRETFQAVVLTISDRCSRGEAQDTAGPAATKRLQESLSAHVYATRIIPDEYQTIAESLKHYCDGHSIDLAVTVGGTGFSPRDVTPEATRQIIERPTPGLDEAMRTASLAKTPHAMLSRGVSGIRGSTLIVNLPGSQLGAVENLDAILPALGHGLQKLRGDPADCGRGQEGTNH